VEGFLPIGWSDEYLDPDYSFGVVRAEIIVELPSSVDGAALSVVDPRNRDAPWSPFVRIDGLEDETKQLLVTVPAFCIFATAADITYAIRHKVLGWKHVVNECSCPTIEQHPTDPDGQVYRRQFNIGQSKYIKYQSPTIITPQFYVALENVATTAPADDLSGAAELIKHLGEDELVRLVMLYPSTKISHLSLDALGRRDVGIQSLGSRLRSLCKDLRRSPASLRLSLLFCERRTNSSKIFPKQRPKTHPQKSRFQQRVFYVTSRIF
jgi:hypothetical protein